MRRVHRAPRCGWMPRLRGRPSRSAPRKSAYIKKKLEQMVEGAPPGRPSFCLQMDRWFDIVGQSGSQWGRVAEVCRLFPNSRDNTNIPLMTSAALLYLRVSEPGGL